MGSSSDDDGVIELDTETMAKMDQGAQQFAGLDEGDQQVVMGMSSLAGFKKATKEVYCSLEAEASSVANPFPFPAALVHAMGKDDLPNEKSYRHFVSRKVLKLGVEGKDYKYVEWEEIEGILRDSCLDIRDPTPGSHTSEPTRYEICVAGKPGGTVSLEEDPKKRRKYIFLEKKFARKCIAKMDSSVGNELQDFYLRLHDEVCNFLKGKQSALGDVIQQKQQLSAHPTTMVQRSLAPEELQLVLVDKRAENEHNVQMRKIALEKAQAEVDKARAEVEQTVEQGRANVVKTKAMNALEVENAMNDLEDTKAKRKRISIKEAIVDVKELLVGTRGPERKKLQRTYRRLLDQLEPQESRESEDVVASVIVAANAAREAAEERQREMSETMAMMEEDINVNNIVNHSQDRGSELDVEDVAIELGISMADFRRIDSQVGIKLRHVWQFAHPGEELLKASRPRRTRNGQRFRIYIYHERDREMIKQVIRQVQEGSN